MQAISTPTAPSTSQYEGKTENICVNCGNKLSDQYFRIYESTNISGNPELSPIDSVTPSSTPITTKYTESTSNVTTTTTTTTTTTSVGNIVKPVPSSSRPISHLPSSQTPSPPHPTPETTTALDTPETPLHAAPSHPAPPPCPPSLNLNLVSLGKKKDLF